MHDDQPTAGSVKTSRGEKRRLAKESLEYNLKNPTFRKVRNTSGGGAANYETEEPFFLLLAHLP